MTQIPVANPGWTMAAHRAEILAAMTRVVDSGWFVLGAEVDAFETEFAEWTGCSAGVGVASGTDAVAIALLACGVGPGDAVFTVSHTAVATVTAIVSVGAVPVLVDIDADTYTMSPESLQDTIDAVRRDHPTLRAAAVVVVHLYGQPALMNQIGRICSEGGLRLIEDAAQAHGAAIGERMVGSMGDAAAFSFYPTKNLGAVGDAGITVTSDPEIAEEARLQRQYGWRVRYVSESVGRNSRLDELHAAVLRQLLPQVNSWNERRIAIAAAYFDMLNSASVHLPQRPRADVRHVFHQYVVQHEDRDGLAEHLRSLGIGTAVLYPLPVHRQPAYATIAICAPDLSVTERVCDRILSLPIGPHLSDADVEQVVAAVRSFDAP